VLPHEPAQRFGATAAARTLDGRGGHEGRLRTADTHCNRVNVSAGNPARPLPLFLGDGSRDGGSAGDAISLTVREAR
jgi:hypothetical protein